MKLERERDNPAFKDKSWRERIAPGARDRKIIQSQILICSTFAPILVWSHWLDENCDAGDPEWYRDQIYLAMKVIDTKVLECIYREHPHLAPPELNDTN